MEQKTESYKLKDYETLRRVEQENERLSTLYSTLKEEYTILRESLASQKGSITEERIKFQKEVTGQKILLDDKYNELVSKEKQLENERSELRIQKSNYEELIDKYRKYKDQLDDEYNENIKKLNKREEEIIAKEHKISTEERKLASQRNKIDQSLRELKNERNDLESSKLEHEQIIQEKVIKAQKQMNEANRQIELINKKNYVLINIILVY